MEELEKQRQLLIENGKIEKKKSLIIVTIVFLVMLIIYLLIVKSIVGWSFQDKTILTINSFNDLFEPYKIYLHLIGSLPVYGFLLLCVSLVKHYRREDYLKFRKMYKDLLVTESLKETFDNLEIDYNKGLEEEALRKVKLVRLGASYSSEDYYKGKYKSIPFETSDVYSWHTETDDEGNTHTVVDFKGQYYIFKFNKNIKENVYVYEGSNAMFRKLDIYVEMEDQEFNKMYSVYSKDKHTAFYLLTPHFMEKLKDINKRIDGFLSFAFVNNELHFAVSNYEDSFECDPFKEININAEKIKIKKYIEIVCEIIDTLDLDNDLFE